jgi:hypothetical protein
MKQDIQLYVEGQRLDLFEDESLQITSSIQDVRDISKVFTDYSQFFSVKASRNNNLIFKHFHDNNITNGFDARKKVDAVIEVNHQTFRKGKIRLDGVQMKNNRAYAYKLTFFGNTVSLKDIVGEDLLSDLDFSAYDQLYSSSNVISKLQSGATVDGVTDAVIVPLISAEQRWFYNSGGSNEEGNLEPTAGAGGYYRNLKFAIRLYCIIKEIKNKYPALNISEDFFNATNANFYGLYMWLHRESGQMPVEGTYSAYLDKFPALSSWEGVYMNESYFEISDVNPFQAQYYSTSLDLTVSSASVQFNVVLIKNSVEVQRFNGKTGATYYFIDFGNLTNGTYKIKIEYTAAFSATTATNIDFTRVPVSGSNTSNFFLFTASQTLATDFQFVVSDNMPEMKVIDFLTGLFKMFNLTAYEESGTIVVKTLNSYYASGKTGANAYDITKYVDMSDSEIERATIYKQINFGFDGYGSLLTKKHNELFNKQWGEEKYNIEQKYDGEIYKLSVPFEHMKFEKLLDLNDDSETQIQWGWMSDSLDENNVPSAYIGKPLVFYAPIRLTNDYIKIKDDGGTTTITQYYMPSNSVGFTDSQTINFYPEINEYAYTVFNDTLFSTYYQDYIEDVFDYRARIVKVKTILPLNILVNSKLNDRFIVNGSSYKINSITTNLLNNKSELELIPDL